MTDKNYYGEDETFDLPDERLDPAPAEAPDFIPDFGDAFADYGEYPEEVQSPERDLSVDYGEAYDEEYDDFEEEPYDLEPPEKPKRKATRRIVPLFVKVLLYVVIVGLIAVGFGYGAWECAQDVLAFGRSDESLTVVLTADDTYEDVAQMLYDRGVIKYPWLFELYCRFTDSTEDMDPGTYELYYNYDYHALVSGMQIGSVARKEIRLTIPEGTTCAKIFRMMEEKGICTVEELEECAANEEFDYWFLEDLPYGEANRLEGFLFPDTYDFYENDDPDRVLDKLLTNFDKKFSDKAQDELEHLNETLANRWASAGYDESYISAHRLSIADLITVASMIEKETAGVTESANISSVIYNRLCRPADYPYLNIDATLIYALGGSIDGALTDADKQVDSPYNTYTHTGLPAGPIANPGLSSITAALKPSETTYYYYALDNSTGYHHFSESYDEHNAFLASQNED